MPCNCGSCSLFSSASWATFDAQFCISLFFPHRRMYSPIITVIDPNRLCIQVVEHIRNTDNIDQWLLVQIFVMIRRNYLPRWSPSCRRGISNMAAIIWTRGLNAAVKTGPFFFTHHDNPTKHKPEPTIPCINKGCSAKSNTNHWKSEVSQLFLSIVWPKSRNLQHRGLI